MNAAVSVGAAYYFMKIFNNAPEYGAIGSAMGTMAGVITALLFMLWAYYINRKMIRKRLDKDKSNVLDGYGEIFKSMLFIVTPIILSTFIYNFNITLNNNLFTNIAMSHYGMTEQQSYSVFGIYSGKAVLLSDVPVALASAMSAALIPVVSGAFVREGRRAAGEKVEVAIHTTMLFAIPAAVGMFALAEPILDLLFSFATAEDMKMAAILLRMMTLSICFYSLSTVSNGILQGIGKVNKPVINAAIALVVQTGVVVGLLLGTKLGIYTLPIAFIIYAALMSLLNQLAVRKEL
jgi:stage V sporulation protein B